MLLWLALKGGILHYFATEAIYLEMNLPIMNVQFFYIMILNLPPPRAAPPPPPNFIQKEKIKGIIIEKTFHLKSVTEKRK